MLTDLSCEKRWVSSCYHNSYPASLQCSGVRAQEHISQLAFTSCLCSQQVAGHYRRALQLSFPAEVLWLLNLPSLPRHLPLILPHSLLFSPSVLTLCRRQELRELRLLQKEEHRNQAQLNSKHQLQLEQMLRRFEQEMVVRGEGKLLGNSYFGFSSLDALQTLFAG